MHAQGPRSRPEATSQVKDNKPTRAQQTDSGKTNQDPGAANRTPRATTQIEGKEALNGGASGAEISEYRNQRIRGVYSIPKSNALSLWCPNRSRRKFPMLLSSAVAWPCRVE